MVCEDPGNLPLSGIKVIELGHAVMGPSCGMILADMGAEVIKVERTPRGDDTRRLLGFGAGLFPFFNRNKKSLVLNLKSEEGKEILRRLVAQSDVLLENFGPGTAERLGFGYEDCAKINPRLVYCSLKGFMPGPYQHRPSLDNLVQMMGGLAFMTGPRGRPLRAGASVIDIMGGTYGALGILAALYERKTTGKGKKVLATLFECTAFLVGQHMAVTAVTGKPSTPMPEGTAPWGVYDLFETRDGDLIFIGITSDQHWQRFCQIFQVHDLAADQRLQTNNDRVRNRQWMIPRLQKLIKGMDKDRVVELCDRARIPFAPVVRPDELFDDPQLNQGGGLLETTLPGGIKTKLPKLPLRVGEADFGLRCDPPALGEGGREVLLELGFTEPELQQLEKKGVVVLREEQQEAEQDTEGRDEPSL